MEPWLLSAARRRPDHPALITSKGTLTFAQLTAQACRGAAVLSARGVAAEDRVAVALPPGEGFAVAVHAVWLAGGVVVPVDLRLAAAEREVRLAGACAVVDAPLATEALSGGAADGFPAGAGHAGRGLECAAAILHTSGTTATPKPVTLTFRNFLASALGSAVALGLDAERERWLVPMPLVHVGGLSVLTRSAIYATTAVLHERFDTEAVLVALSDAAAEITLVSLVPTMLARLLDAGLRTPPTLRHALLGGGPIAPALLERAVAANVPVIPTYGMTEACSQIATAGWPLPGTEIRLDAAGEILIRGDTVAPAALADDGWLHSGDLGSFDGAGRLRIVGRRSETIVTGGENVAPTEVEAALLEHPAVADAGVFAVSDPEWGEAVHAAVVLRPGTHVAGEELRGHCAERLARYKVPKLIVAVPELPRSPAGKLLRRELPARGL